MNNYLKNGALGSKYWIDSYNKDFFTIQKESNLPPIFLNKLDEFSNNILQPINKYAYYYSKKPQLIKYKDYIVLRQKTHSEIWVEPKHNGLYALDKAWQRQFYISDINLDKDSNCFDAMYKFYTPWIINKKNNFEIKSIKNSPFLIKSEKINFDANGYSWIYFLIKKNGKHMNTKQYGIVDIGTPMFDIIIKDKDTILEIIKEYEK